MSLLERLSDAELVETFCFTLKPETSLTCSTEQEKLYLLFSHLITSGKHMCDVKMPYINHSKIYAHFCPIFHLITVTVKYMSGGVGGWVEGVT